MSELLPSRLLIVLAVAAALTLGYFAWAEHQQDIGDARATARWTTAIDHQKAVAAQVLSDEKAKVATAERALQDFKSNQDLQDAVNQKTVSGLSARIRSIGGAAGQLRDPFATGCGRGGSSAAGQDSGFASDRADDAAQAGRLLSPEFTQFFESKDDDADAINLAYISCRADASEVRLRLNTPALVP